MSLRIPVLSTSDDMSTMILVDEKITMKQANGNNEIVIDEQTFTDPDQHIETCDYRQSHFKRAKQNYSKDQQDIMTELCMYGDLKQYVEDSQESR